MPDLPHKLKRLNIAVRELSSAQDQPQLLERILDVVAHVFGRQTAAVLLREGDDQLRMVAARGYDAEVVADYTAPLGRGVSGTVAATGEPRLVADVSAEPDYVAGVTQAVSEMAVPLSVDGEVIGVLDVESCEGAFDEQDMALLEAFGEQAAWAIRHGQVVAQAERRARKLELLNQAARALNAIHDPEQLLTCILTLAREALGIDNAAVLVVDAGGRNLVVRKALRSDDVEGLTFPVEQGITGAVFRSGKAEVVPDVAADPRYIPGGTPGACSEMVAPLNINGSIIGVLDAEACDTAAFSALDLEVFSAFAAQVATALRNAELLRNLEDRAQRLRQITRISRALNTVLDADALMEQILDAVAKALGLERTAILLFYPQQAALVAHAARGYGDVLGNKIPVGQGVTGTVAETGEALLVNDVTADERYLPGVVGGAAEMAVPLKVYGELFGVLDTESPTADAFTSQDLDLFQAFADQAAVALHNARQFRRLEMANEQLRNNVEETRRLNSELEAYAKQIAEANAHLERQIGQLTSVHQAGQAMTSSLDLSQTLNTILAMTGEIAACSVGAIKLIDLETKELRVMAHQGVANEDSGPFWKYDVPLKIGERTIGVFELVRKAGDQLGDTERKMLETLAAQAAIAIENARLFEDTQQVYYETLKSLARALEARDDYTRGHSERVAQLSRALARDMGLDETECGLIFNSALLHDIGKIGVRDEILLKPRQLTEQEMDVIRKHPTFGNVILGPLKFLGRAAELVMFHHERWDGTGYPDGLEGEKIPLPSRIIAVCDTYDAMTSDRPYRGALTHGEAMTLILKEAGRQLDPAVVEVFAATVEREHAAAEPPQ